MSGKDSNVSTFNRRTVVGATGTLTIAGLAGCTGGEEDEQNQEQEVEDDTSGESTEETTEYANKRDDLLELPFGEEAQTDHGIVANAEIRDFEESYWYEGASGTEREAEPDSGNQFVFIDFYAENQGDEEGRLPPERTMDLLVENEQFDRELYRGDDSEVYEGDDVLPGVRREGLILFQAPEDAEAEDVVLVLNDGHLDEGMLVRWVSE